MSRCAEACRPSTTPNAKGACVRCGRSIPQRDRAFEQQFFDQALGPNGVAFARDARIRLERGEELFGSRALSFTRARTRQEIREEALDLACYAVLGAQSEEVQGLPEDERMTELLHLRQLAAVGLEADRLLGLLAEVGE